MSRPLRDGSIEMTLPFPMQGRSAYLLPYEREIWNVKQEETEELKGLLNARLALKPSDILHDLIDIFGGDSFDLRHVAKFPMVRLDAGCRSPLKGGIPVMVRLINLMH